MGQTLTAVFDDRGAAQHALYKLLAAGFGRADAALSLADAPSGTRHRLTLTAESPKDADRAARLVGCLIPADGTLAAEHYGTEMHNSEKYRNRSWDEVDRELERGWEQRYHGAARWDEWQAAIRRGWLHAAPEIDEDIYYRTHWNAQYAHPPRRATYRRPANGGGAGKSRDSFQQHLRRWTAAAAGRKASWASRHEQELPPWARFKDAVLHGWGRIDLGNGDTPGQRG